MALLAVSRRAMFVGAASIAIAVVALARAIVTLDYRLTYVADVANRAASRPYRLAGLWAQMAGSLLLFAALAAIAGTWGARIVRRRAPALVPVTMAFAATVAAGLAMISRLAADPFARLRQPAIDGAGLTPILEHWAMLVHPPLLYVGLVATVPLASMAVAAWWTGADDAEWRPAAHVVAAGGWTVLTLALALGGRWAYAEVGWGGFWAWDPVENGGLLVWLALLVVLHRTRRTPGTVRSAKLAGAAWATFAAAVLGVLITRSGAAASVHAFGEATRVGRALSALAIVVLIMSGIARWRWTRRAPLGELALAPSAGSAVAPSTTSSAAPAVIERLLGLQQLVTSVVIVVVGVGTLYPVVGRWIDGRRRVVDARFYTASISPLAAVAAAGIVVTLVRTRQWWRRGALAFAHIGMLVFLAGAIATSLGRDRSTIVAPGGSTRIAGHELIIGQPVAREHSRYRLIAVPIMVRDDGGEVARLTPALRVYETAGLVLPETALRSTLAGDLQVSVRRVDERGDVTIDVHVRPLAWLVWLGALLIVAGGLAALIPAVVSHRVHAAPPVPNDPAAIGGHR